MNIKDRVTVEDNIWQIKENEPYELTKNNLNNEDKAILNIVWFTPKTQPENQSWYNYSSHPNSEDEYSIDDKNMWAFPEGFDNTWNQNEYLFL